MNLKLIGAIKVLEDAVFYIYTYYPHTQDTFDAADILQAKVEELLLELKQDRRCAK